MVYKSPLSGMYYFNKAKDLYAKHHYEQSIPVFERSLFADEKNLVTRYYYVLALSKSKPTYTIQQKLHDMGRSNIDDEAKKYARFKAVELRKVLLEGFEHNYIFNAISGNDILRWDINSFPLKVYFENLQSVPSYYKANIDRALMHWSRNTNFISFKEVSDKNSADIVIKFADIPEDVCVGNVCKYSVAYTEPEILTDKILKRMNLTFYKTNPRNGNFTSEEIYNTSLHEIGHALGIMGHSENVNDVMYSSQNDISSNYIFPIKIYQGLSYSDLKTVALLYRLKPTISNTKDLSSESFYYPPLILGSENARLEQKLKECLKYIAEYPNFSAGYINISGIYSDMGKFDLAFEALEEARKFAKTTDEKFLVEYNFAVVSYNSENFELAMKYAKRAKEIKSNSVVVDLISDIEKIKSLNDSVK